MSEKICARRSLSDRAGTGICQRDQKEYHQLRDQIIAAVTDESSGISTVHVLINDGWVIIEELLRDLLPTLEEVIDGGPMGWKNSFGFILRELDVNIDRVSGYVSELEGKHLQARGDPGYVFLRDSYAAELGALRVIKAICLALSQLSEIIQTKQQSFAVGATGWDNFEGESE